MDDAVFGELSGELADGVRVDAGSRALYATDASIYEIEPLAVATPRNVGEVRACVRFAARKRIPIIARGAGTGLAGESLGRALILDLTTHFNKIEYDAAKRCVTVGPGVVLDELNAALKAHGVYFPVDPSSSSRCTLGGMIANNTSGARSLRFGDTRTNLISVQVILADGTETQTEAVTFGSREHSRKQNESGLAGAIYSSLPALLNERATLIAQRTPTTERNSCGYALNAALLDGVFDFAKLVCGSQGTLGIVTEAVFRVWPLPRSVGMCVVYFESLADAAASIETIREQKPLCCELMDDSLMKLGRKAKPELAHLLPANARAMLVIEMDGESDADVLARLAVLKAAFTAVKHIALALVPNQVEQTTIWSIRNAATPLLFQRTDLLQPTAFVEDAAVLPEKLGAYLARAETIFSKHGIEWSAYAHAGAGEVHIRPMMHLRDPKHAALLEPIASEMHQAVWDCGGVISGEHGDGLARTQFLERQFGSELFGLFKRVKIICDPQGILNPDKKISNDPHLMTKNLRTTGDARYASRVKSDLLED